MKKDLVIKEPLTGVELNKKLKTAMNTIDRKLKKLGVDDMNTVVASTNGAFKMNENDSNTVQIFTTPNLPYLINALSLMMRMQREYLETANYMEVKIVPTQNWCNYNVEGWIIDLERTIKKVSNADQISKLRLAKTSLSSFLSQEDRLFSTLTDLSELLK